MEKIKHNMFSIGWLMHHPPNLYVELYTPVTQNVAAFGERNFKEMSKLK